MGTAFTLLDMNARKGGVWKRKNHVKGCLQAKVALSGKKKGVHVGS